jgi:hypothetical protein
VVEESAENTFEQEELSMSNIGKEFLNVEKFTTPYKIGFN